jgi:hypothetical protein
MAAVYVAAHVGIMCADRSEAALVVYDPTAQCGQLALRGFNMRARNLSSYIEAMTAETKRHLTSIGRPTQSMQQALVSYVLPTSAVNMLTVVQDLEQKLKEAFAQRAQAFSLQKRDIFAVSPKKYDDDDE